MRSPLYRKPTWRKKRIEKKNYKPSSAKACPRLLPKTSIRDIGHGAHDITSGANTTASSRNDDDGECTINNGNHKTINKWQKELVLAAGISDHQPSYPHPVASAGPRSTHGCCGQSAWHGPEGCGRVPYRGLFRISGRGHREPSVTASALACLCSLSLVTAWSRVDDPFFHRRLPHVMSCSPNSHPCPQVSLSKTLALVQALITQCVARGMETRRKSCTIQVRIDSARLEAGN